LTEPAPAASADVSPGRVVLVATPIGNLDDLSPRAVAALAEADVVAAEDTRHTKPVLDRVGVTTPLTSYHEHNEAARTESLIDRAETGEAVAVVCDAGTPGLADPGFRLVRAAAERGITVEAVPGPAAVVHALIVSGLPTDRFAFEGFLPRKQGARQRRLGDVADDSHTLVFYVTPHRAADDLDAMVSAFGGQRPAALARELTKRYEEVWRASLAELAERARAEGVRGEVTVVVAGAVTPPAGTLEEAELARRVRELIATGLEKKAATAAVASATGEPKRRVYDAVLGHGSQGSPDEPPPAGAE
jgi:16S rRNA (cytidine1402-2'-O)-methyltransferase